MKQFLSKQKTHPLTFSHDIIEKLHDRYSPIRIIMEQFSKDLRCKELSVKHKHKATSMHLITLH